MNNSNLINLGLGLIKGLTLGFVFLLVWHISGITLGFWGIVIFFAIILLAILLSTRATAPPLKTKIRPAAKKALAVIVAIVAIAIILLAFQFLYPVINKDSRVKELKAAATDDRGVEFYSGDCYPLGDNISYRISKITNNGKLVVTCYLKRTVNGNYPWARVTFRDFEGFVSTTITPINPKDGCKAVFDNVVVNTATGGIINYSVETYGSFPDLTLKGYNVKTGKYKDEMRGIIEGATCDKSAEREVVMTIVMTNRTRNSTITNFRAGGTV